MKPLLIIAAITAVSYAIYKAGYKNFDVVFSYIDISKMKISGGKASVPFVFEVQNQTTGLATINSIVGEIRTVGNNVKIGTVRSGTIQVGSFTNVPISVVGEIELSKIANLSNLAFAINKQLPPMIITYTINTNLGNITNETLVTYNA